MPTRKQCKECYNEKQRERYRQAKKKLEECSDNSEDEESDDESVDESVVETKKKSNSSKSSKSSKKEIISEDEEESEQKHKKSTSSQQSSKKSKSSTKTDKKKKNSIDNTPLSEEDEPSILHVTKLKIKEDLTQNDIKKHFRELINYNMEAEEQIDSLTAELKETKLKMSKLEKAVEILMKKTKDMSDT